MIYITVPKNNRAEREYIIDIVFSEFLDIEYKIIEDDVNHWKIEFEEKKSLIFEDSFFNGFVSDLGYLNIKNIPNDIQYILKKDNEFITYSDIPVIFGNNKLIIEKNSIYCGIDIFASCFFMLTRWEEYVNKKRDKHNRFSAYDSCAFKNKFIDRAVVDEYINMLNCMLLKLGYKSKFKESKNNIFLTHDVDEIYRWKSWKQVLKVAIADLIKRQSLSLAFKRVSEYYHITRHQHNDPYDTFDWLMDRSETINLKSRFYFMSGGTTKYDNRYNIKEITALKLIERIKKRKHIIGIHPSYNAYNNIHQLKKEKDFLEETIGCEITEGREHYLRFEVPTTWQIWDDVGLKTDSTCGYADCTGFRCGTGKEYSVFNILTRKKLTLKERPLIVMDSTLFEYNKLNDSEAEMEIKKLEKASDLTLLWHNSSIDHMNFYQNYFKKS